MAKTRDGTGIGTGFRLAGNWQIRRSDLVWPTQTATGGQKSTSVPSLDKTGVHKVFYLEKLFSTFPYYMNRYTRVKKGGKCRQ